MLAIVVGITDFKKWGYLMAPMDNDCCHKRIGIMYLLTALPMLFRGGVDALMMRYQLSMPENTFLDSQHYN